MLRVNCFSIDGFGAGPRQSLDGPVGVGATRLHEWMFATRTLREMYEPGGGETGVDDEFVRRGECWRLDLGQKHVRTSAGTLAG